MLVYFAICLNTGGKGEDTIFKIILLENSLICPGRIVIKDEWIEYVIENFEHEEIQSDNRIRRWAFVKEEKKYLRVILLSDAETVHNAFFDRNFRRK